jgi:hypothetical protein
MILGFTKEEMIRLILAFWCFKGTASTFKAELVWFNNILKADSRIGIVYLVFSHFRHIFLSPNIFTCGNDLALIALSCAPI